MKNITIFLAASVLCFISAPAFAREPGSFTGGHAELITGYDRVDADAMSAAGGLLYGLNAGYDVAAGGAILGLEAEISDSTAKKRYQGGRTVTDRDLYIGGRIGVPLGDGALAYAKAGYTNARFEYSGSGGEGGATSGGHNADGLRLGAGLEYQLGDSLFLKGEYRYSNYEAGLSRHQIVTGIGFRF